MAVVVQAAGGIAPDVPFFNLFVAVSRQQAQQLGSSTRLPKAIFGNGSSIPLKFCCADAVQNAENRKPPIDVVRVYQARILQSRLAKAMKDEKADVGCWDGRLGLRWKEDLTLDIDVDFWFDWPCLDQMAAGAAPLALTER